MGEKMGGSLGKGGARSPANGQVVTRRPEARALRGIVIANGRSPMGGQPPPTVVAFIWGGKVRPTPSLPYGRLRGAA
jgi:hypothetical protein